MSMMGSSNTSLDSKSNKEAMEYSWNKPSILKNSSKKFGLENAKVSKIPMSTTTKLDKNE